MAPQRKDRQRTYHMSHKHTLVINNRTTFKIQKKLLEQVLIETINQFGPSAATETSLAIVSDPAMKRLNKLYRGKNRTTDVLSFSFLRSEKMAVTPHSIGEIILSPTRAKSQALEFGHSAATETALLFLHGLLHILGFDHEKSESAAQSMARAEKSVLQKISSLKKTRHGLVSRELVYPAITKSR